MLGGGSAAAVLAAILGIPKGIKAKKAANERKKVDLAKKIAEFNARAQNGNGNETG